MIKAFKYRIRPNSLQQQQLQRFFGASRFIYNACLETKKTAYESNGTKLSNFDLNNQIKDLKQEVGFEWLKEVPSQALNQASLNLTNAFQGFFKGKGYPKFKSRRSSKSVQVPQGLEINNIQTKLLLIFT